MLQVWFKLFFRNSKKNWLNTLINIGGLTLGLVGLTIVLLYYNKENSYDKWNPNKDVIYKVAHSWPDGQIYDDATHPEGPKSKEIIPEITDYLSMPSWYNNALLKANNGKTTYVTKIVQSTPNFFEFFPHEIIEGTKDGILASKDLITISSGVKKKLFGTKDALGNTISYGKKNYTISGVFEVKKPSTTEPEVVVWGMANKSMIKNWDSFSNYTYYKLKEGADIKAVEEKLKQVFIDNFHKANAEKEGIPLNSYLEKEASVPFLEKLNGFRLHSKGDVGPLEGKGNYLLLLIMMGLSVFIIIISSINFINLSIASASLRGKEVGIKKTLGISTLNFNLQYVLEIIIQGFVALLLALLITELILPNFNDYFKTELSLRNVKLIGQISVLTLIISSFIGVLYALYLHKFKTIEVLKGNFSRSKNMVLLRNLMLGLQFIISGFFLVGGLVVYNQVSYMSSKDLGFSGDQILVVNFANGSRKWERYELVKKVFRNNPNILSVSTSMVSPGADNDFSIGVSYKDKDLDTKFIPVDYNHLEMIKAEMKHGRSFSEKFASDSISGVILNETAVKLLGIEKPVGKKVGAFDKICTIIGVVKDYHLDGFDKKIRPVAYMHFKSLPWLKYNSNSVHFKIKEGREEKAIAQIENFWRTEVEPGYPLTYSFVNKAFEKTYEKYRQQQTLFGVLTFVVIIVALLGLFALASLTIQQRLKEVAIRKTLGASVKEIMYQLIISFVKNVLIASVFLIPVAYYLMQNWLNNFAYRIDMPILPYIISPIILILLVITVVGIKAYNATKVDLIKYLKFE
ncbi:hypothetical protein WH52_00970 [Tenacibaculum holothuriorum]|uniref:ABC transporter permease n=1 Tax=Tenacibaculum holothuriorum TaxID=1635173 RepID=A0A1Y2PGH1_9FLAO|nr:ABC transporter permease [Tenacibaculum holothuriorum]OSY89250.1 hypothetical protein WH52_00970 [Tenacibaculum holothuriorum]